MSQTESRRQFKTQALARAVKSKDAAGQLAHDRGLDLIPHTTHHWQLRPKQPHEKDWQINLYPSTSRVVYVDRAKHAPRLNLRHGWSLLDAVADAVKGKLP